MSLSDSHKQVGRDKACVIFLLSECSISPWLAAKIQVLIYICDFLLKKLYSTVFSPFVWRIKIEYLILYR